MLQMESLLGEETIMPNGFSKNDYTGIMYTRSNCKCHATNGFLKLLTSKIDLGTTVEFVT